MNERFSIRQILACLNVSVFDPVLEPALMKACRGSMERKKERRAFLHYFLMISGMCCAALVCFAGLLPYALPAGVVLTAFSLLGTKYSVKNPAVHFCFKTYLLAGFLLLAAAFFETAPFVVAAVSLAVFLSYSFSPKNSDRKLIVAVLFFFLTAGAFYRYSPVSVPYVLAGFSFLGFCNFIFPLKGLYWRRPSIFFLTVPVLLLLADRVAEMCGLAVPGISVLPLACVFSAELVMLAGFLWKDMEAKECFYVCLLDAALIFLAFFLAPGVTGAVLLLILSFFTDARSMGVFAVVMLAGFLIVLFLSLPMTFVTAGIACLGCAALFGLFYYKLKCLSRRKEGLS